MATLVGLFMRSYSSLPLVDWEAETYPAYSDYAVLPIIVAFFPALRLFLDRFIFEIFARTLIFRKGHGKLAETNERRKKVDKFKESAWKFVYHLSAELLTLSAIYNESWLTNTRYFWVGPGDLLWPDQKIKLKLKLVHMYATGFNVYSVFALLYSDTRRKDFGVMMAHHVCTVILCYVLYWQAGKMAKYSGCERLAIVAFLLFVASWILLRLIIFPFWIIRSTSYEVLMILDKERQQIYRYYAVNCLLSSLLLLHIYWSVLMYRMLLKQIQSGGRIGDDVRSDSEGEDDHED